MTNFRHAASRVRTCEEPEFSHSLMNCCSSIVLFSRHKHSLQYALHFMAFIFCCLSLFQNIFLSRNVCLFKLVKHATWFYFKKVCSMHLIFERRVLKPKISADFKSSEPKKPTTRLESTHSESKCPKHSWNFSNIVGMSLILYDYLTLHTINTVDYMTLQTVNTVDHMTLHTINTVDYMTLYTVNSWLHASSYNKHSWSHEV